MWFLFCSNSDVISYNTISKFECLCCIKRAVKLFLNIFLFCTNMINYKPLQWRFHDEITGTIVHLSCIKNNNANVSRNTLIIIFVYYIVHKPLQSSGVIDEDLCPKKRTCRRLHEGRLQSVVVACQSNIASSSEHQRQPEIIE